MKGMSSMPAALASACLLLGGATAWTQEVDAGTAPSQPTSGPSLSNLFRGLRDRAGRLVGDSAASAPTPASSAAAAATSSGAATVTSSAPPSVKIKDLASKGRLPADWYDANCKNLVEPFSPTDNAASLAVLKGRETAEDALRGLLGKPTSTSKREQIHDIARRLNWLPMPAEVMLGQRIHDAQTNLLREDKASSREPYARARRLLTEVLAGVREAHPYNFRIFVTTASDGNAEAAPGGFIYVDKNLVDKAPEEPRARFAIAHEISHVLQRHRTRETQERLVEGMDSIEGLVTLLSSVKANPNAVLKVAIDTKRLFVRHSEEQELQADGCAVRLLDAISLSRADMIKSLNAFVAALPKPQSAQAKTQVKGSDVETVLGELTDGQLSRHPSTEKRVKTLKKVLTDLGTAPR